MSRTAAEQPAIRISLSPAERERLRALITQASGPLPTNWPIGTFISRNPLAGFEHLPFEQAIHTAEHLTCGRGTLSPDEFRRLYRDGRITAAHLGEALQRRVSRLPPPHVIRINGKELEATTVLGVHLRHGLEGTDPHRLHWALTREGATSRIRVDVPAETRARLRELGRHLLISDLERLGPEWTVTDFLSRLVGPGVEQQLRDAVLAGWRTAAGARTEPPPLDALVCDLGLPGEQASRYLRTVADRLRQLIRLEGGAPGEIAPALIGLWLRTERALIEDMARTIFHTRGRIDALCAWLQAHPETRYLRELWTAAQAAVQKGGDDAEQQRAELDLPPSNARGLTGQELVPSAEPTVGELLRMLTDIDVPGLINQQMIKWGAALLDQGLAGWRMPLHADNYYASWKELATWDRMPGHLEARDFHQAIEALPSQPEDAVAWSLHQMGIPAPEWPAYLAHHLWFLPGWAGYIKCQEVFGAPPDEAHLKLDLTTYLAVRLSYEALLGAAIARRVLDLPCTRAALQQRLHEEAPGRDPGTRHAPAHADEAGAELRVSRDAWRLFHLAQLLALSPEDLDRLPPSELTTLLGWLNRFPVHAQGMVWLEAYEAIYRNRLISRLASSLPTSAEQAATSTHASPVETRPEAQAIFCIDVRSEPLRRHLEAQGSVETFGYAGFFGVPLAHTALDAPGSRALCPVLIKPKFRVREMPRPGRDREASRHRAGTRWHGLLDELFHDLKSHPLSSYMLIDCLGPVFGAALTLKTVLAGWFAGLQTWAHHHVVPSIATHIPTGKPTKEETESAIAREERAALAAILPSLLPERLRDDPAFPDLVQELAESVRLPLLDPSHPPADAGAGPTARSMRVTEEECTRLIATLRERVVISPATHRAQLTDRALFGLALAEQAQVIEAGLRLIGLTRRFAPLVLVCGHGSTTQNNPFAAAYDCGACGGNPGDANARVFAALANTPQVRQALAAHGITIPDDTIFLAGKHDTTLDRVRLYDLEDLPHSHHAAVDRFLTACDRAGAAAASERCGRLPGAPADRGTSEALRHVRQRGADWAQVRPEWGLSGNAAFIIGPRQLSREHDLKGRVFLHSYDSAQDSSGKALETIMTAPLVVAEWINLQYYFSSVDPWTYGSGSKIYHNVVGGIGVMLGSGSDLQAGLPLQSVHTGPQPFHEPMRLLAIIQAPPDRIAAIIEHHAVLKRFFDHEWVHLVALDPSGWQWSQYRPGGQWTSLRIAPSPPGEESAA